MGWLKTTEIKEEYLASYHFKGKRAKSPPTWSENLLKKMAYLRLSFQKPSTSSVELCFSEWMRKISTIYASKNNHHSWSDGVATIWSALMPWPWFVKPTNDMKSMTRELVIVKADSVEVQDYDETSKERASYTAELRLLSDIGKGTYPYYILERKSMSNQLSCIVIQSLYRIWPSSGRSSYYQTVQEANRIYILAAVTSACWIASKKMLEELTNASELGISSEWGIMVCRFSAKTLFIFVNLSRNGY